MDVELTNTTKNAESLRHMEVGAFVEPRIQVHKVLTHNIVQDEYSGQAAQVCEDPVKDVVHVALTAWFC